MPYPDITLNNTALTTHHMQLAKCTIHMASLSLTSMPHSRCAHSQKRLIEQARALPAWTSLKDNSVALRSS